jgi:hypothetical protein
VISVADPDPFDTDPDLACHFDTDPAFQFDPDPYSFKEVMYPKQVFFIHLNMIFLVGRSNRTRPKQAYFVKLSPS